MFLALAAALAVWASVSLAVYAALRWAQTRAPRVIAGAGLLAFSFQLVVLSGFLWFLLSNNGSAVPSLSLSSPAVPNRIFDVGLGFTLGALWLLPIVLGARLMQIAKQEKGGRTARFLFCPLFIPIANGASWFVLLRLHLPYPVGMLYTVLGLRLPYVWRFAFFLCFWAFPLGAPLAEIALRSFQRAAQTNATGSLME